MVAPRQAQQGLREQARASERFFEYAARLAELVQRQEKIEDDLELTKDQASRQLTAGSEDGFTPCWNALSEPDCA